MGLILHHYLDRAQPTPTARVKRSGSATASPAAGGSSAAAALIRRVVLAVTRRLLLSDAPSARDRRPSFVPSAVLLKGRGRDVDSLAAAERARAALGHIVAAVRDRESSPGTAAAHKAASGT